MKNGDIVLVKIDDSTEFNHVGYVVIYHDEIHIAEVWRDAVRIVPYNYEFHPGCQIQFFKNDLDMFQRLSAFAWADINDHVRWEADPYLFVQKGLNITISFEDLCQMLTK